MQTKGKMQTADCRLQTEGKMQTEDKIQQFSFHCVIHERD